MNATRKAVEERFWAKVQKTDTCWVWTAATTGVGYGHMGIDGKMRLAHRVSWFLATGSWPTSMLDHMCRNRLCVNPEHLREVTSKQNQENRAVESPRSASGFRGVHWDKLRSKWRAQARSNGRRVHVGSFDTIPEAVEAVQDARRRLHTHNDLDRITIEEN